MRHSLPMSDSPRRPERVTLADVAAKAGVSETTASNALTGRRHVAPATRASILLAVRELGYRPNRVARALRQRTTSTVAIVVNDIGNVSFTTSIRGASAVLRSRGYAIDMVDSPDEGPSLDIVQQVVDRLPTGAIFFGEEPARRAVDLLEANGVPFVVGGLGSAHHSGWDVVFSDQQAAVKDATATLAAREAGRVCFFGGNAGDEGARARLNGFLLGMAEVGRTPEPDDIVLVPYSLAGGRAAMAAVLDRPPSLVVGGSDQIALGAMLVARAAGIRMPGDMRVVGFDNIDSCEVSVPSLSSIDVQLEQQGLVCAELLLDRIDESYSGPGRAVPQSASFIARDSTRLD